MFKNTILITLGCCFTMISFAQDRLTGITHRDGFDYQLNYVDDTFTGIQVSNNTFFAEMIVSYEAGNISEVSSSSNDSDPAFNFHLFFHYDYASGDLLHIGINEIAGDEYLLITQSNERITNIDYFKPNNANNSIPFYITAFQYDGALLTKHNVGDLVDVDFHHINSSTDVFQNEKLWQRKNSSNSGNYIYGNQYSLNANGDIELAVSMNFEDPDPFATDSIGFEIDQNQFAKNIDYPAELFKILNGYRNCGYSGLFDRVRQGFVDKKVLRLFYPFNNETYSSFEYESQLSNVENDKITADFTIYPNPSQDVLLLPNLNEFKHYEIFVGLGNLVVKEILASNKISIVHLSPGTYVLRLSSLRGVSRSARFIKL